MIAMARLLAFASFVPSYAFLVHPPLARNVKPAQPKARADGSQEHKVKSVPPKARADGSQEHKVKRPANPDRPKRQIPASWLEGPALSLVSVGSQKAQALGQKLATVSDSIKMSFANANGVSLDILGQALNGVSSAATGLAEMKKDPSIEEDMVQWIGKAKDDKKLDADTAETISNAIRSVSGSKAIKHANPSHAPSAHAPPAVQRPSASKHADAASWIQRIGDK